MTRTRMLLLILALATPLACTNQAAARTLPVGPDQQYKLPSAAIGAARDGDTVRIVAGRYVDCAVVSASNLVIEGTGADASAVLTDKICDGKALLVTDGANITIRNLTLTRAHVPEYNGAGIRAEGRNLTIEHVKFIDDEDGILSAPSPEGTITIRDSEFIGDGKCAEDCAHGVYAGAIALL